MAGLRRAIDLAIGEDNLTALRAIARSRTEQARSGRAGADAAGLPGRPLVFRGGAEDGGENHQTVRPRCVERAVAYGPLAGSLDDLQRPGRARRITAEAKAWIADLACRKAKELGYPHELWTTRLLARPCAHARSEGGPRLPCHTRAGHVVQHPQRAGDKAAQGPLLPGTPRPGVQAKDGRGPVRLSRGQAHQRDGGGQKRKS